MIFSELENSVLLCKYFLIDYATYEGDCLKKSPVICSTKRTSSEYSLLGLGKLCLFFLSLLFFFFPSFFICTEVLMRDGAVMRSSLPIKILKILDLIMTFLALLRSAYA